MIVQSRNGFLLAVSGGNFFTEEANMSRKNILFASITGLLLILSCAVPPIGGLP